MQRRILESPISPRDWAFVQALPQKLVYSVKEDAVPIAGSKETAYRRLAVLRNIGIVDFRNGHFSVNHSIARQPYHFIEKLLPSLYALKNARRFGRSYNDSDIRFVKKSGFSEGTRGHIVLLPISQRIENEIEQVYFDSIAKGGRGVLDAIAIELLYPDEIMHKGQFPVE